MTISIRPLRESDLPAADRICRLAFGTFLGLPDPAAFMGDAEFVRTRWAADPTAALAAELDGELVGSNIVTSWGSFGFFGPLTVRPDLWDRGIAGRLLEATMALFDRWGTRHVGLFTFAHSPKHLALYQKFGFWPRFLTPVMARPVAPKPPVPDVITYAGLPESRRGDGLGACRDLTDATYPGLDLEREIRAVHTQGLGDTVLLHADAGLAGFAVCHCGPGSEAGGGACYVKFGAVKPGPDAGAAFDRLLDACEALAGERGLQRMVAGVNVARHDAYRRLLARGYRAWLEGVIMQRPNEPGYCLPDVYVIDDLR